MNTVIYRSGKEVLEGRLRTFWGIAMYYGKFPTHKKAD